MGLGVFIAKTLLERSGAEMTFGGNASKAGACVKVEWPRNVLERETAMAPAEDASDPLGIKVSPQDAAEGPATIIRA